MNFPNNMNRTIRLFPFVFVAVIAFTGLSVSAQPPSSERPGRERRQAGERRPNLMAELGLSPEQMQQIKTLNAERRPLMQQAQRRLREANRALDAAIYADTVNDAEVSARMADYYAAQNDAASLRFNNELAVRKILTPEQLLRFRELRKRFAEARQESQQRRGTRRALRNRRPAESTAPDNDDMN